MSTAPRQARKLEPFGLRLIEGSGIEPLWLGLAAGLVFAGLGLFYSTYVGVVAAVIAGDQPTVLIFGPAVGMLIIGLAPAAMHYQARWTERNLELIAPEVDGEVDVLSHASRPNRLIGIGMAILFVALFLVPSMSSSQFKLADGELLQKLAPWISIMVVSLGWLIGRLLHAMVMDALAVSRLAARLRRVDLLGASKSTSAPFVNQGQGSALLMIGFCSLSIVLVNAPRDTVTNSVLILSISTLLAIVSLLLPVQGIRSRIRAEKREQLAALRGQIDAIRADVLTQRAEDNVVARLPGLLALEVRIESVREWPFDASSLLRVGFYLLIGLGSWIGAAAIERLLDWSLR